MIFCRLDIMTRLTVNIDNRKSEKVILAVVHALGLSYEIEPPKPVVVTEKPLNKAELAMYKRLKKSFEQIKLHQEGKIELKTIEEVLAELS
jgi:hypothetical protein